jgi:hypothetical protein
MLEPIILEQWLLVQRNQLLKFFVRSYNFQTAKAHFVMPTPLFTNAASGSGDMHGAGVNSRHSGFRGSRSLTQTQQQIIVSRQELMSISLECVVLKSSFLKQSSACSSTPSDGTGSRRNTVLTQPQREMKRFLVIQKALFSGMVEADAIANQMPEDVACSVRTVRHYRQRLLDATLLHILCDYFK